MASDLNRVTLIGRLTRDAEQVQAGETTIQKLRLAVTSRQKAGGEWQDRPNYFDVTVFGNTGIAQYLVKGKQIGVDGRLSWREWEKDGQRRQAVEVVANDVFLLGGKSDAAGGSSSQPEDIPFGPSVI